MTERALYLVRFEGDDPPDGIADEAVRLAPGLWLAHSEETRSGIYHRVKRLLPAGTPLLVAPLADHPKFKGMAPGALAWLRGLGRERFHPDG